MAVAPTGRAWENLECDLGGGIGTTASIGLLALARDRVTIQDIADFCSDFAGVGLFASRIPSPEIVTPETLRAISGSIEVGAANLAPGSHLDAMGFCCTSATAAIGAEKVAEALRAGRGDVPVTTPMEAAVRAFQQLGVTRIDLVTPYLQQAADLVANFFEAAGIRVGRCGSFLLDGDDEMNRVSGRDLHRAVSQIRSPKSQATFISCTAVRTAPHLAGLEDSLGLPVLSSNQVMAWDCLRLAGVTTVLFGAKALGRSLSL